MTTLSILKGVNLDPLYNYTIDFNSKEEQLNYFNDLVHLTTQRQYSYSYLRTNVSIEVPYSYEQLENCNYCYYVNNNKVYYNFITSVEYVNPNNSRIIIKLDVFQTYMFDYTLGECFVEREHQDRIDPLATNHFVYNIEPESIELGNEYFIKETDELNNVSSNPSELDLMYYYVWATGSLIGGETTLYSTNVNGQPTNTWCYVIPVITKEQTTTTELGFMVGSEFKVLDTSPTITAKQLIEKLAEEPKVFAIGISKFPPSELSYSIVPNTGNERYIINSIQGYRWGTWNDFNVLQVNLQKLEPMRVLTKLTGKYLADFSGVLGTAKDITREPKLMTYPYKFYKLHMGDVESNLKPELFEDAIFLDLFKSCTPQSTTCIQPNNYAGSATGKENELLVVSNNNVALRTDSWVSYYNSNKATLRSGLLTQVGTAGAITALGLATGGIGLAVAGTQAIGTFGQVASAMQQRQNLKESADTIRSTGDDFGVNDLLNNIAGELETFEVQKDFKEKAYSYFYRRGYACRRYKTPNVKSRYYFNFIKTNEFVASTNQVPADALEELKEIYNAGVTIWHYRDASTFDYLNYNLENWETFIAGGGANG